MNDFMLFAITIVGWVAVLAALSCGYTPTDEDDGI